MLSAAVAVSDRDRVRQAFQDLRKQGILARMNFEDCSSCAGAALSRMAKPGQKIVYFHQQDNAAFKDDGNIRNTMMIRFGVNGTVANSEDTPAVEVEVELAQQIVRAMNANGIPTFWEGDVQTCVAVMPHSN